MQAVLQQLVVAVSVLQHGLSFPHGEQAQLIQEFFFSAGAEAIGLALTA